MTGIISFSNKNVIGNLGRTFGLACIVMILAFTFLTGSIIVESLRLGEANVEERLGADLMAVPAGSGYAQESILVNGTASSFYMPATLESEISAVMGVKRVSSQVYMTSISDSDCCEFLVQLIAYNPDTDFTIKPWIAESYSSEVGTDQLVVGSNIQVTAGHIRLFDHQFEVVARLAESGTGMDNSVFMVKETMRHMIAYAIALGFRSECDVDSDISVVLVDIDQDYSMSQMVRRIQSVGSGSDVDVVSSADVVSKMTMQMGSLIEFVEIFKYTIAAASVAVLATLFATTIISRKREFAMLRMIGATRGQVASAVVYESAAISFFGALAGIALSMSIVLPFSGTIGGFLGMPYMSPTVSSMIPDSVLAFLLAFAIGPLSSVVVAFKLSRNETYALMKEGE